MDKWYAYIVGTVRGSIWWALRLMEQIMGLLYVEVCAKSHNILIYSSPHPHHSGIDTIILVLERLRSLLKAIQLINGRTKIQS